MRDDHDRFRSLLAAYLAEVLPADDAAWLEGHVAGCASCADLIERVRRRLPELAHEGGHIPVSLLELWALEPESMSPLECEIVRRHVAGCELCRGDVEELAAGAVARTQVLVGAARATAIPRWLVPTAAAAAVLLVLFLVRGAYLAQAPKTGAVSHGGEVTGGAGGTGTPTANPVAAKIVVMVLADRERSASAASVQGRAVIGRADSLQLQLPALFIPDRDTVVARVLRADGGLVWEHLLNASALGANLAPVRPVEGWRPGRYRLVLIPSAGRDTTAARKFVFELEERTK